MCRLWTSVNSKQMFIEGLLHTTHRAGLVGVGVVSGQQTGHIPALPWLALYWTPMSTEWPPLSLPSQQALVPGRRGWGHPPNS